MCLPLSLRDEFIYITELVPTPERRGRRGERKGGRKREREGGKGRKRQRKREGRGEEERY